MNAARKIQPTAPAAAPSHLSLQQPAPWQPARSAQEPEMELICRWEPTGLDYPKMQAHWVLVQKG